MGGSAVSCLVPTKEGLLLAAWLRTRMAERPDLYDTAAGVASGLGVAYIKHALVGYIEPHEDDVRKLARAFRVPEQQVLWELRMW